MLGINEQSEKEAFERFENFLKSYGFENNEVKEEKIEEIKERIGITKNKRDKEIMKLYLKGSRIFQLAKKFKLSNQRIDQIIRGYKTLPKYLREYIIERYGFECFVCKNNKAKLEVHHIDGNSHNNGIENLVSLCKQCHTTSDLFRRNRIRC